MTNEYGPAAISGSTVPVPPTQSTRRAPGGASAEATTPSDETTAGTDQAGTKRPDQAGTKRPDQAGTKRPDQAGAKPSDRAPAGGSGTGVAEPATPSDGSGRAAGDSAPGRASAGILLAVLALAWLAAMLWSAQASITSAAQTPLAIASAAYALPGVISASLLGGAAVALAAVNVTGRRWPAATPTRRFAVATGMGLAVGLVAALTVIFAYGDGSAVGVLAGTIAAASTVGGATAGTRVPAVIGGVVAAGLAVFAVGFVLNLFQEPVLNLYGFGDSEASQLGALGWFALTASLTSGLAAGLVAFGYLQRWRRQSDRPTLRWPAYALAGAGPGMLLLAGELLTRTAGARILELAVRLSDADRAAQSILAGSRINHSLVVLFIGAIAATIAFGRTLGPPIAAEGEAALPAAPPETP